MSDDAASSSRSRLLTWAGGLVGGVVVLVLAVALLLPQLFSSEELKSYVIPPIEEATGRTVQIGEIGLRVLPAPAVRMSDFEIANAESFSDEPAVSGRAFRVDVALWPLFSGNIVPTAVELVDPVIRYQIAEDGTTNFDTFAATDTTQTAEEGAGLSIPVSNFRMSGARVLYSDASTGQSAEMDFDAQLSALPQDGGSIASEGTVDISSLRAVLSEAEADTMAITGAQLRYDLLAAMEAGRIDLTTLRLDTAPLTLSASGTVTELTARPRLDLTLEAGETNLGELAAFVPAAAVEGLNPSGTLQLTTTIRGLLPDSTGSLDSLRVDGRGSIAGLGVDYQGSALLRDVSADLSLSLDSASIRSIRGQLLGRSLEGQLAVADLRGEPTVDGRLAGAANLAELSSLAASGNASGEAAPVQGSADYDVRFSGPLDTPDAIRPRGRVRLADVQYPVESLRDPLQIPEAVVELTGSGLSMDRFTLTSGEQQMALETTVRDLFPLSKGLADTNPAMAVDFTFTSERLDLIQLFPEEDTSEVYYSQLFAAKLAGSRVKGQDPEVLAEELYGDVELPAFAVDGRVEIETLLNEPQRFDDLTFDAQVRNRRLEMRNLTAQTYGGQLAGTITLDQSASTASAHRRTEAGSVLLASRDPGVAPSRAPAPSSDLSYDVRLTGARASAFLEEWTTLGRVADGTLDLNITGNSPLSGGLLPLAEALTADGRSIVANGGLSLELGAAQAFVDKLGLRAPSLTDFQQFGGPFTIQNGALQMGEWTLGGNNLNGTFSGSMGLGGALDLTMRTDLPLSTLQDSKIMGLVGEGDGLGTLVQKLVGGKSGSKTVPVEVRIGGTMGNPQVSILNKDAVRSGVQQIARDAGLLNRLRNLFDGGGGGG